MNTTDLLTVEEAARYLKISKGTVWRWCRTGKLRGAKIGHLCRIRRKDLEAMIESDSGKPQQRLDVHI